MTAPKRKVKPVTASPRHRVSASSASLARENAELKLRLQEAEETLRAIHEGEVDAVIVSGTKGEQIFSLVGTDSIYRLIVETMKEAAFTVTFDGTILFCNARFGEFVKRPTELIVGHRLREFVDERSQAAAKSLLLIAQKQPVKQRLVFQDLNCKPVPAHVSANVLDQPDGLSICIVANDLTELENSTELIQQLRRQQEELKTANKSLAESEARYHTLFLSLQEGFYLAEAVFDSDGKCCDARYLDVNPAFERIMGLTREQIIGKRITELVQELKPEWLEVFGGVATTGKPVTHQSHSKVFNKHFEAFVFRPAPGQFGVLVNDISQRKQDEDTLVKTADELARSNRDLESFAHVASHDLQEPLRMVSGFLSLLQDSYRGQLDARAQEYIGFAVDGATRMAALIRALLDYSRASKKEKQEVPVNLAQTVKEAVSNLNAAITESGAVVTIDPLPTVTADAAHMQQLFQNLIGNAIKFRPKDRSPVVHVTARRDADAWLFQVRDNGIGIPPEQQDRLFVIFQRLHTPEAYPGTGIGLATCKRIVERQGGRIWVESVPGQGSTFCFTLPAM